MDETAPSSSAPMQAVPFQPLSLELDDLATYGGIADGIGVPLERCVEGFMLSTPRAREAALRLWEGVLVLRQTSSADAIAQAAQHLRQQQLLDTLRALLGLAPALMTDEALVAAGLRYRA